MLKSMTAFARQDASLDAGTLTWELRSVNHRYLEPSFRLPEAFREAEPRLRDVLRRKLARGKVDCALKWQPAITSKDGAAVNADVLQGLVHALDSVSASFSNTAPIDAVALLQWPGLLNNEASDRKQLLADTARAFEKAVDILVANREREGAQLAPLLESRLEAISKIVLEVRQRMPEILKAQHDALVKRVAEVVLEVDASRLEQELVMLAQKSDVAEELDRLDAHVNEVSKIIKKSEPVGRRLDFLMQELNREANTLSSKSIVTETTNAAVELKVLIEQMREQIQNIE